MSKHDLLSEKEEGELPLFNEGRRFNLRSALPIIFGELALNETVGRSRHLNPNIF